MNPMRSGCLMLLISAITLTQGAQLMAAQRPSEIALYNEMDRFLSPNELQLAELQRERQDLLESRENEKNIRILKNKITILNNKIAFLQRQIKLNNPYMVTQRLVPAKPHAEDAQRATLTQKLDFKRVSSLAPREAAEEITLPVAAVQPTEGKSGSGKTGADWKKMTRADKEIYILSIMGSLSRRDVYLMKPYGFYIQSIDKAIENNPHLEKDFVHLILMTTAYDSEPDSRKHLEKVWK